MTDVEQIKSRLDIADIVSEYVPLKAAGANMKGICPFHEESTPSFMVHQGKQIFHCFGCQKGGDIFTFIQEIENIEFPEALRILAQKAGVQIKAYNPEIQNTRTKINDVLTASNKYFAYVLTKDAGAKARDYLIRQRGLTQHTIEEFSIGFAPVGWDYLSKYLISKKFDQQIIMQSGMVVTKERGGFYDRFRGRIMFPIADPHGQIIGFSGRLLPEDEHKEKVGGKYINSPETPVFNKSAVLFGLHQAKQSIKEKKFVILAEGQMDVIGSHQAGVTNIVAAAGTAITSDHLRILKRLTDTVVFALDQDTAGLEAMKRAVSLVWAHDMHARVIRLPESVKDPADLVLKDPGAWIDVAHQHQPFFEYYSDIVFSSHDLDSATGKREAARQLLPFVKDMSDPITRSHYIEIVSNRLGVEKSYIQEALEKTPASPRQRQEKRFEPPSVKKKSPIETHHEYMLALAVAYPQLQILLINEIDPETLNDSQYAVFYKDLYNWYNKLTNVDPTDEAFTDFFEPSSDNSTTYSLLELKAEQEFSDLNLAQAKTELRKVISSRKKLLINQEIQHLAGKLKTLEEHNAKHDEITQLSRKIDALTKELSLF